MNFLDIGLIFQIIFFFCFKYEGLNLKLLYDNWVGFVLPVLILLERFAKNIKRRRNTVNNQVNDGIPAAEQSPESMIDEKINLRNHPHTLPGQTSDENKIKQIKKKN